MQIIDCGRIDDVAFICMEFVEGLDLQKWLKSHGAPPVEIALLMIRDLCRGLEHAHSRRITHRDIKPANILVAARPGERVPGRGIDIKITDFGSAVNAASDSTLVTGIGSPAYMSPEQIRDEALTFQTDIYSLGVVMFQLLTGQLPFSATNSYGLMYQIAHGDPVPLNVIRPDLPDQVVRIVHRAIEREPAYRYSSWNEFSFDLATLFETAILDHGEPGESEKFSVLRSLAFFNEFADSDLWEVLRISDWEDVAPGRLLMAEGSESDHFAILASGEVRIAKRGKLLAVLHAGDCFGEMVYLQPGEGGLRSADVSTATAARIITIHAGDLRHASESCQHRFDRAFMRLLVSRLTQANERLSHA